MYHPLFKRPYSSLTFLIPFPPHTLFPPLKPRKSKAKHEAHGRFIGGFDPRAGVLSLRWRRHGRGGVVQRRSPLYPIAGREKDCIVPNLLIYFPGHAWWLLFAFTIYVMGESIRGVIVAKPSCQHSSKHVKGEADHGWRRTKGDMTG